jgi:transposase
MPRIDVTLQDLRELRARLDRRQLEPGDWGIVGGLVESRIARTEAQLARLQAKLDQHRTGKAAPSGNAAHDSSSASDAAPSASDESSKTAGDDGDKPSDEVTAEPASCGAETDDDETDDDETDDDEPPKGHGRNGAAAFTSAKEYLHALGLGLLGALCAACGIGRMSPYRDKVIIRVVGQSIFRAERHRFQQARCRLCGAILRADGMDLVLDGIGTSYVTYHWSACAMLIVMHYFAGAPFKRLEALHRGWGIPMPDANQWQLVDRCDDVLAPLYKAVERYGIQNATSLLIDDTGSLIIELRRQIQEEIAALQLLGESPRNVRTGINATGVYLKTDQVTVVLFFTGRHHAGEIIDQLLQHRRSVAKATENKLVKVTDAASKNFDHAQGDLLEEAVCNAHAFLKFRAIKDAFPVEYGIAGEVYKKVFDNDDEAKARGLDPLERMHFHRRRSMPEMERLWQICKQKLDAKLVEPHSPLWEPISFVINQWARLTRFCEVPGVPLDTNLVEQTLIIPVRYLAGSFAYKTQNGADVGDRHMSLVATANANGVEPVAYLTHCLENHRDLAERPEHYLPWVYKQRLEAPQVPEGPERGAEPDQPAVRSPAKHRPHPLSVPPPIGPPPPVGPPPPATGPPPP